MMSDLIEKALAALRNEQYARAVAIADQLAAEMPENPLVRAIRAQGLLYSDNPEAALPEAKKAVELDPANPHAQLLLAYAAWRSKQNTLAQESFKAAVRFSDHESLFLAEFAWFLANERAPKIAETFAQTAIETDETSSTAWAALGLAQLRMHRRADAETSLHRAIELNPDDIYAQSAMVALLQDKGLDREAIKLASRLSEHAGAEDLADDLRKESKERKLAAMLVERNIDLRMPAAEPTKRFWPYAIIISLVLGVVFYIIAPDRLPLAIALALLPLLLPALILWLWREK
jgi:Tfp pilus assembly protein PilF